MTRDPGAPKQQQTKGDAAAPRLAAAGVGTAPVVGFVAAGAQLAALLLGHGGDSVPGRWIQLSVDDWKTPPVLAATTMSERLLGLRRLAPGRGLLLFTRAVHGWALRGPIRVVRLDSGGRVSECRWLEPRRHLRWPKPGWTLELPSWHLWPPEGAALKATSAPPPPAV